MRRFIILSLLCLLPVQISWAEVAGYCGHEQDKATQHFGHHNNEHKASPGALDGSTASDQDGSNSSHDHCHLSSFLGVLSEYTFSMHTPLQLSIHRDNQSYSFLAADKPARPNWLIAA
ncbi:MAG: hypothetical protein ABL860_03315 [Candidatus Nitrotoga sp.]